MCPFQAKSAHPRPSHDREILLCALSALSAPSLVGFHRSPSSAGSSIYCCELLVFLLSNAPLSRSFEM